MLLISDRKFLASSSFLVQNSLAIFAALHGFSSAWIPSIYGVQGSHIVVEIRLGLICAVGRRLKSTPGIERASALGSALIFSASAWALAMVSFYRPVRLTFLISWDCESPSAAVYWAAMFETSARRSYAGTF